MKIFLDDIRKPSDVGLSDADWTIIRDPLMAWQAIQNGVVSHLSLDHDLGECPTGYDLCKWMAENDKWPTDDIYIHSKNIVGVANMKSVIDRYFYELKNED